MGGEESLATTEPVKTVGSYWPYATSVFSYIRRAMPFYNPQSLSDEETYAITAYVFYLNDLVDEEFDLNRESIMEIECLPRMVSMVLIHVLTFRTWPA